MTGVLCLSRYFFITNKHVESRYLRSWFLFSVVVSILCIEPVLFFCRNIVNVLTLFRSHEFSFLSPLFSFCLIIRSMFCLSVYLYLLGHVRCGCLFVSCVSKLQCYGGKEVVFHIPRSRCIVIAKLHSLLKPYIHDSSATFYNNAAL